MKQTFIQTTLSLFPLLFRPYRTNKMSKASSDKALDIFLILLAVPLLVRSQNGLVRQKQKNRADGSVRFFL
jgi:hypothetical protein